MERWVDDITISTSSSHRKPCILSYNYKASPEWQRSTQCDSLIMAAADKSSILLLNIVLHTVCQEYYYSAFPCTQQHCFSNDNRFFGGHVYGQSFHGCQLLTREWCPTSKYYTSFGWCSSRQRGQQTNLATDPLSLWPPPPYRVTYLWTALAGGFSG